MTSTPVTTSADDTERTLGDIVALRRALHRRPEIGLDLPGTQQLILDALEGLDLEIRLGEALSSVTAVLRGGGTDRPVGERPVVLLRGDMDALPVAEDLPLDYVSEVPGAMHACGHDLHVAALVGAARLLHAQRDTLPGDVVLMFQPGEEGDGGADIMIREGLLEVAGRRVDAAYALHVSSHEYPRGQWFGRSGPLMAGADKYEVRVLGDGGHGSTPFLTRDPVPVACEIVLALQAMVTRRYDVFDPVVVTVGSVQAGTKDNIIPDSALLQITVRTLSTPTRERIEADIRRVVDGITAAHGLTGTVEVSEGYPVTVNDAGEYEHAVAVATDLFGADRYSEMPNPMLGAEDFSFVLDEVPGAYLFIGASRSEDYLHAPSNHSPRADFDDAVLPDAARWLAEVGRRRLHTLT